MPAVGNVVTEWVSDDELQRLVVASLTLLCDQRLLGLQVSSNPHKMPLILKSF